MSKFCAKCGKAIADDALFCDGCGAKVEKDVPQTVSREEAIESQGKKKGCGCFTFLIVVFVIGIIGIAISVGSGISKENQVDKMFLEQINTVIGSDCRYNMSDHRIWYDDTLKEYIGTGSLTTSDNIKCEYTFRACIMDNTVVFVKADLIDPLGNSIIDYYDEEKETAFYESLNAEETEE